MIIQQFYSSKTYLECVPLFAKRSKPYGTGTFFVPLCVQFCIKLPRGSNRTYVTFGRILKYYCGLKCKRTGASSRSGV